MTPYVGRPAMMQGAMQLRRTYIACINQNNASKRSVFSVRAVMKLVGRTQFFPY